MASIASGESGSALITCAILALPSTSTTTAPPGAAQTGVVGINDVGQEAGYSSLDPAGQVNQLAYVRQGSGLFSYLTLPTNVNSQATDINNADTTVGFYMPTADTSDGFILSNGQLTTLQVPGSTFTQALGENNEGQVVGFYNDANGAAHGFVYSGGLYTTVDVPGASATTINGINDAGTIVGFDTNAAGNTEGFDLSLPLLQQTDTTTGLATRQAMAAYAGPVSDLNDEFINLSPTTSTCPQPSRACSSTAARAMTRCRCPRGTTCSTAAAARTSW